MDDPAFNDSPGRTYFGHVGEGSHMASISQERRGAIMTSVGPKEAVRGEELGKEMHDFIVELYPICRSITGAGVRETLRAIRKRIPLEM